MKLKLALALVLLLFALMPTKTTYSSTILAESNSVSTIISTNICEQEYLFDHFILDMWYESAMSQCGNNYYCRNDVWWNYVLISDELIDNYMNCQYPTV